MTSFWYKKRNLPDGFQVMGRLFSYVRALDGIWQRRPATVVIRFPLFLHSPDVSTLIKQLVAWVQSGVYAKGFPSIPKSDVIIFLSSKKPNIWPAGDRLVDQLVDEGNACLLLSPDGMEYLWKDGKKISRKKLTDVSVWSGEPQARSQILPACIHTVTDAVMICTRTIKNPLSIVRHLVYFHVQRSLAEYIVSQSSPHLVITNGDHIPMGAALTLAANARGIHTIWWFNEHPTTGMLPYFSKEIWIWNEAVKKSLEAMTNQNSTPVFTIIGNSEIDSVLQVSEKKWLNDLKLSIPPNAPVCLFLSEYDANPVLDIGPITEESLLWIDEAAKQLPHWYFVIGSRPVHEAKKLPGSEIIEKNKNIIFSNTIPTHQLLRTDQVKAVAACGTQGLFVAAGLGKPAIRLLVSTVSMPFPVIDEVAIPANSPDEFITRLKTIEQQKKFNDENRFSHQSKVIEGMNRLINEKLQK